MNSNFQVLPQTQWDLGLDRNLRPSLKSFAASNRISSRVALPIKSDQLPRPCRRTASPQHDAASTMLHSGDGGLRRGAEFSATHSVLHLGQKVGLI